MYDVQHDDDDDNQVDEDTSEDQEGGGEEAADEQTDSEDEDVPSEMPEELRTAYSEARVYLTQAKRHRAELEKARGFYKKTGVSDAAAKEAYMKKLKHRLPCTRCGGLGHWKDDKECPKYGQADDGKRNKGPKSNWMTIHDTSPEG